MNSQQCSCLHKTCKDQTHQHTDVDWKKMSVGNVCWGTKNQFLVLFCFVFRDKTSGLKGQLIYICTYANTYKVIRLSRSYIHTHTHVVDLLKKSFNLWGPVTQLPKKYRDCFCFWMPGVHLAGSLLFILSAHQSPAPFLSLAEVSVV